MNQKEAYRVIAKAKLLLNLARSGDPRDELSEERIAELTEEVERAEMHMEDSDE